jgi:hypothetical protein
MAKAPEKFDPLAPCKLDAPCVWRPLAEGDPQREYDGLREDQPGALPDRRIDAFGGHYSGWEEDQGCVWCGRGTVSHPAHTTECDTVPLADRGACAVCNQIMIRPGSEHAPAGPKTHLGPNPACAGELWCGGHRPAEDCACCGEAPGAPHESWCILFAPGAVVPADVVPE